MPSVPLQTAIFIVISPLNALGGVIFLLYPHKRNSFQSCTGQPNAVQHLCGLLLTSSSVLQYGRRTVKCEIAVGEARNSKHRMGDKGDSGLNSRGTFRSPFLSVRIQEERSDEEDTVIDIRGANGASHIASSSGAGTPAAVPHYVIRVSSKQKGHDSLFNADQTSAPRTAMRLLVLPGETTGRN